MGQFKFYDSMYFVVCKDVQSILSQVFSQSKQVQCRVTGIQRQHGTKDCGLFAMAVCTFLAFGRDQSTLAANCFDQHSFRSHLIFCFESYCISEFP